MGQGIKTRLVSIFLTMPKECFPTGDIKERAPLITKLMHPPPPNRGDQCKVKQRRHHLMSSRRRSGILFYARPSTTNKKEKRAPFLRVVTSWAGHGHCFSFFWLSFIALSFFH